MSFEDLLKDPFALVLYVCFSALIGLYAQKTQKGTFLGYFIGSMIFSPVIAGIFAFLHYYRIDFRDFLVMI